MSLKQKQMQLLETKRETGYKLTKKQLQQLAEWKVLGK